MAHWDHLIELVGTAIVVLYLCCFALCSDHPALRRGLRKTERRPSAESAASRAIAAAQAALAARAASAAKAATALTAAVSSPLKASPAKKKTPFSKPGLRLPKGPFQMLSEVNLGFLSAAGKGSPQPSERLTQLVQTDQKQRAAARGTTPLKLHVMSAARSLEIRAKLRSKGAATLPSAAGGGAIGGGAIGGGATGGGAIGGGATAGASPSADAADLAELGHLSAQIGYFSAPEYPAQASRTPSPSGSFFRGGGGGGGGGGIFSQLLEVVRSSSPLNMRPSFDVLREREAPRSAEIIPPAKRRGSLRTPIEAQRERKARLDELRSAFFVFNSSESGAMSADEVLRFLDIILPEGPPMDTQDALSFIADNEESEDATSLSFDGFVCGMVALVSGGVRDSADDLADLTAAAEAAMQAVDGQRAQALIARAGLSEQQRQLIAQGFDEDEVEEMLLEEAQSPSAGATARSLSSSHASASMSASCRQP